MPIPRLSKPLAEDSDIEHRRWATGISVICYGVRVGIRVSDRRLLKRAIDRLPPLWKRSTSAKVDHLYSLIMGTGSRRLNQAYWNAETVARSRSLDDLLDALESHVQLTVAEHAPRRVFVHAGVVGWKGKAIVIPGLSYSGKTTMVSKLIQAGATYYSDEYAVVNARGQVYSYPRRLGMRMTDSFEATKISAAKLGGKTGVKPLRVGLVLSIKYKPGARWRPRRLTKGEGVLELLANTVSARSQPELALIALPKALTSARILKGVRGEAEDLVDKILASVD